MKPYYEHAGVSIYHGEVVFFVPISLREANDALLRWGHKMGPLHRGNQGAVCHGLFHGKRIVAVTTTSSLISATVAGGHQLRRGECCELSRLCAERSGLCRVMLRLWRDFAFPLTGYKFAISYQDADLHSGNTYRFDGWKRITYSRSGVDTRSGRKGRNKWIWVWPTEIDSARLAEVQCVLDFAKVAAGAAVANG